MAWFGGATFLMTLFLLYAGGFTTTIRAGMVFLDWPLSNGSINPPGWIQNTALRAEHSHRLLGALVGLMTLTLGIWLYRRDDRRWVRILGIAAIFLVIFQGLLGGFRVLLNSVPFAAVHGIMAQAFLCVLMALILANSPLWWKRAYPGNLTNASGEWTRLQRLGLVVVGLILVQLVIAAVLRHRDAGLAIPTFPLTPEGGLIPTIWSLNISLNFLHRLFAAIIFAVQLYWVWQIVRSPIVPTAWKHLANISVLLLFLQIGLGAMTIWTERLPVPTTLHVFNSALLLGSCWAVTFLFFRNKLGVPLKVSSSGILKEPHEQAFSQGKPSGNTLPGNASTHH